MAAWSSTASAVAAPVPARRPREARRPVAHQRRLTGGILWIAAFTVLLAGVVALNVAVLRLNMGVDRLDRERVQLQNDNQALASQVSSAAAAARIEAAARRTGLRPAAADATSYVELGP